MARNRAGSRLSFRRSSSSSLPHIDAHETAQEKHRFQVKGKADPSKAINEAEPAAVATSEVTLGRPLRDLEHRDHEGNVIVDADRSNPTRHRMERPLDTIRAFEAAIDGSYYKRQSFRAETPNPTNPPTRRSSYFNNRQPIPRRGYSENPGYHSDRAGNERPDSYYNNESSPSAAYYGGNNRRFGPRNNSDPALYGSNQAQSQQNGIYPNHGHHQSYDTFGTSNGSHVTEPWGASTDPSSENSSIERMQPPPKADLGEAYGFNGFGGGAQFGGTILEEYGHGDPAYGEQGYGHPRAINGNGQSSAGQNPLPPAPPQHGAPAPPPKEDKPLRMPVRSGAPTTNTIRKNYNPPPAASSAGQDKRKSWIKKRFSRS